MSASRKAENGEELVEGEGREEDQIKKGGRVEEEGISEVRQFIAVFRIRFILDISDVSGLIIIF